MVSLSPEQFLARIAKQPLSPAYLFVGPEAYYRKLCREALLSRALPGEERQDGLTQIDLEETSLSEVLDDACSLSLFSRDRVLWVTSAELALPRRLVAAAETEDDGDTPKNAVSTIGRYIANPSAGTTLVFESSRYDFSGDDRARTDRVLKFYEAVPIAVEFRPLNTEASRFLAQELARKYKLKLAGQELAILLDAVAGDANRLSAELEKLSLFLGPDKQVTSEDLSLLVPNAAQSTIFTLVNALGKGDRMTALTSLKILVREGEYLPLALTFLSTQFRLALAAKEAKITSTQQAVTFFTKLGVRIWRDRAEQVLATASAFTTPHLRTAVALIYDTDKKFREGYKDDQLIMEGLVLALTK